MWKNAEKMDLSSRNRLLRVPAGSHGFWAHDPLPDPSHDPDVDPRRVTIPLAFTIYSKGIDFIKLRADKYSISNQLLSSLALITSSAEG